MKYTTTGIIVNNKEYLLEDIIKEIKLLQIKEKKLVLLQLYWDSTRSCDEFYEYIVLSKTKAEFIKNIMVNKTIYFGEVCGKHSEVYGELEEDEIIINDNVNDVLKFMENNPNNYNCNHSFIQKYLEQDDTPETEELKQLETIFDKIQ